MQFEIINNDKISIYELYYIKTTIYKTVLHSAVEKGNKDIVNLLLSNSHTDPNLKCILYYFATKFQILNLMQF